MEDTDTKDAQRDSSVVFTKSVMEQIQKEDVVAMVEAQREMLTRYEKTNEMLLNFNMLSSSRYGTTMLEFKQHTDLLYDMKKDLDTIFRRIRVIKGRLSSLYPEAFSACGDVYYVPEESDGEKPSAEKTPVEESTKDKESREDNRSDSVTAVQTDNSLTSEQKSGESYSSQKDTKENSNVNKP